MKKRPKITEGDIVRLSKKGKQKYITKYHNTTMIVKAVHGDGVDYDCTVDVIIGAYIFRFERSALWKTGFNVKESTELDIDAPVNNNNREHCYLCEMPTKTIKLFSSSHQICTNSNCNWFEN